MITYLTVTFNSDGAKPSEVAQRLHSLGFVPTTGNYDFMYEWGMEAGVEEAVDLADQVHLTLKGMMVSYKIETV
ncbi:MAG: hypothetical protein KAU99_01380 [Thermoplasmata archaeon]|nr:hypothetical protein [Thermoplasmata archaeon]MCK4454979.1 hypothetical protein [Thermoplasmata archaeon]